MILPRLGILLGLLGNTAAARRAVGVHASIWRNAADAEPGIIPDLIRQGGLMTCQPVQMNGGLSTVAPIDPYRLAYEAGKRDLALQLIAAAGLGVDDINRLFKEQDHE